APEYGGDGGKKVGECANKIPPIAAFQAHWAPDDLLIYDGKEFPDRFRGGAFIAFHGSWNRAPFPQAGYNVTFQPLKDGKGNGRCEIFADGFAGSAADKSSGKALHRPTGLAVGPEGAMYISDDARGRIYRITYIGSPNGDAHGPPCPAPDASPGKQLASAAAPPEGLKKDAGTAALPVPPGSTQEMVETGSRVYHAQLG